MSRRRFLYTQGGHPLPEPIEVTAEWTDAPSSTGDMDKFQYDNMRATDGTDISSRTKRRAYMKANGLTDPSDFKETWAKAAAEREAYRRGEQVTPSMREAVGRAAYQLSKGRRR